MMKPAWHPTTKKAPLKKQGAATRLAEGIASKVDNRLEIEDKNVMSVMKSRDNEEERH